MMRLGPILPAAFMLLTGCSERVSSPAPTAEALAADPEWLQETLKRCKTDRAKIGDAACRAASEAYRKRFMGDGKPNYTPQTVDLFPHTPDKLTPKPISRPNDSRAKE